MLMMVVWRLKRRQKKEKEQSFSDDDIYNDSMICDIWNSYKGNPGNCFFIAEERNRFEIQQRREKDGCI